MRVDIDFKLAKDENNELRDTIMGELADKYDWNKEFGYDLISGDVPDITDNATCQSKAYDMFIAVVREIATKSDQTVHIDSLRIYVNWVARSYKPGHKIQYAGMQDYKDILIKPIE